MEEINTFLSYPNSSKDFAARLHRDLVSEGVSVWRDEEQLQIGDNLVQSIRNAILESKNFLALISEDTVKSTWFSSELATALAAIEAYPNRRIIPVLMESGVELPPFLRNYQAIDLSSPEKYEKSLPKLITALKETKFSGPLPPPHILEQYEKVAPGMAEAIIGMAEKEGRFRRELARLNLIKHRIGLALLGSLLGTIVIIFMVSIGSAENSNHIFIFLSGLFLGIIVTLIDKFKRTSREESGSAGEERD